MVLQIYIRHRESFLWKTSFSQVCESVAHRIFPCLWYTFDISKLLQGITQSTMVAVQNEFYNMFSLSKEENTSKITLVAEVKTFHLTCNYQV